MFSLFAVQSFGSEDSQKYLLNVSRLAGSETALKDVHVPGAYFVPGWKPEVKRFTVYLNLEEDLVKCQILKRL